MKKLSLTTIALTLILGFSSCTQDDTVLEEPNAEALLKAYKIQKNSNGEYSLDMKLKDGVGSENIKDKVTNTNNIYLYSSEYQTQSKVNQELAVENGQLKIGFNDTKRQKQSYITILDDKIVYSKDNNEYLESYSIDGNEDGSYDLTFKVKDNIGVNFIYNEDEDAYEIHLNEDEKAVESDFFQTFNKESGEDLKLVFVNHYDDQSKMIAKDEPVIIIQD